MTGDALGAVPGDTAARRRNLVPGAYRSVSVSEVDCELDEPTLAAHFIGMEAYRRTRFIVVRRGAATAVLQVQKESEEPLFSPITTVSLLVGPDECVFLELPETDTAVPSALGRAAHEHAPDKRGVVVQGTYAHVSFILDPAPLCVTVREVVPPYPAKLFDQAQRLLDVAQDLPPILLQADVVELEGLARSRPSGAYLLPCVGGGAKVDGATTSYLDQHPEHQDWTLVGCERSQQIHDWFYGERAEQVDICPWKRPGSSGHVLAKCCLLESDVVVEENRVIVPWGASLSQISEGLQALVAAWEPTWTPA